MKEMKALTLWQPYASLVAEEIKLFETRSWRTNYRGPLAIHAGKRDTHIRAAVHSVQSEYGFGLLWRLLKERGYSGELDAEGRKLIDSNVPFGCVVCIVSVVDVYPTEIIRPTLDQQQVELGDYRNGRFAWQLRLDMKLEPPIEARGRQGLWNWDPPPNLDMSGIGNVVSGSAKMKFAGSLRGEAKTQS